MVSSGNCAVVAPPSRGRVGRIVDNATIWPRSLTCQQSGAGRTMPRTCPRRLRLSHPPRAASPAAAPAAAPVADAPGHRRVAQLPPRPRPDHAAARRGAPGRPRAVPRRVRRPAPDRPRPRSAGPDERPGRAGHPVAERDHPARRPARGRRRGRAGGLHRPTRAARRRSSRRSGSNGSARRPRPTSTASAATSSTGSTTPTSPALEASLGRVADPLASGTPPDPRGLPAGRGLSAAVAAVGSGPARAASRIPAWSPRFYPPGTRGPGSPPALRLAARDRRAEQHVLSPAEPGRGRRLARRDARRLPVRGQGPARLVVPRPPGRCRPTASPG